MKTAKLIDRVGKLLDAKKKKACKHKDCLKEILKQLKKKQHALKAKLKDEKSAKERRHIQKQLDIIRAQRKKGLTALKKMD